MHLIYEKQYQEKFFRSFIIIFGILFLLNLWETLFTIPSWQIRRAVGFGFESNIPTWFTSCLLLYVSYIALFCSVYEKVNKKVWQAMSFLFLMFSCDEVAKFHERVGKLIGKYVFSNKDVTLDTEFHFGIIFLAIFFSFLYYFFKKVKVTRTTFRWIVSGFIIYFFGAIVLESLIYLKDPANNNLLWRMENLLEESFEIIGALCVLKGVSFQLEILANGQTGKNE